MFRPKEFFIGFFINKIYYPLFRRPLKVTCYTICQDKFVVWLPAGLDIYLLGMKSHDAEIRLSQFILNEVRQGIFIDIGAHFGFYTLLASNLLENTGNVISIEPSRKTFTILKENAGIRSNVELHQNAVSTEGPIVFREYDVSHSEFNKLVDDDGSESEHFERVKYLEYEVSCLTLDMLGGDLHHDNVFIKMDVEGAEYEALLGGVEFLSTSSPILAMEYHVNENSELLGCQKGAQLLDKLNFKAYVINHDGRLSRIPGCIDSYLSSLDRDVDNLIFKKEH
jgi:FkbM family methyltransferase